LGDGTLKRTFVKKSSAKAATQSSPASYSQAVLQQCPDVEEKLEKLCAELAMCQIEKDPDGILNIIATKLAKAVETQAGSSRPLYQAVNY
jgi:hypothetical protein